MRKKTVLIVIAAIVVVGIIGAAVGGNSSNSSQAPENSSVLETNSSQSKDNEGKQGEGVVFSGKNYSAEYVKCFTADSVEGVFYIDLKISNTGDAEQTYTLEDIYVDDTHCNTGTGLPVTAAAGKKVTGSFIVFCETSLENVKNVDFKLNIRDKESMETIETSDVITIQPNS